MFSVVLSGTPSVAQELEPRAYWPSPVGTNAAIVTYVFSRGDFVTDATFPELNAEGETHSLEVGYYRGFSFFGRSANFTATFPYVWANARGGVEGVPRRIDLAGSGDPRFRLSVNLVGGPAMTIPEFQTYRQAPKTILGASIRVRVPLGEYDPDRVINLGTNRWGFKPQVGLIQPITPKWLLELRGGAWFFTDNDDFLGELLDQGAILNLEADVVYRLRPGLWASFDVTYFSGGRRVISGEETPTSLSNTRLGGTLAVAISGPHIAKFTANTGLSTRSGNDFNTLAVSYTYGWIDRP